MLRKIARFLAPLALAVGIGLTAYTAYAYYDDNIWQTTVYGTTLQQGVAIQVNLNGGPTSSGTIWGATVTWASRILDQEYARVAGGENCDGFPTTYFDNYIYAVGTSSVQKTGFNSFPARPCQSWRYFNVRGWSTWTDFGEFNWTRSHNQVLQYRP